ncbi:DUF4328 domain-containing protein [Tomitella fengzijianii]|uniref:DUF4328 domain-containing protein n=1 Tax=Tomitella fengzijianii TaxID=2597660 RepID=UPI00131C9B1E|nr:DUF4328 domain-containing protein [Tomitella fengzijianii]
MLCQQCTRCGTFWPVAVGPAGPVPARWCPHCQGDLSRPFTPRQQQARPGQQPPREQARQQQARPGQTLQQPPPQQPPQQPVPRPVVSGTAAARMQGAHRPPGVPQQRQARAALPRGYRWVARPPTSDRGAPPRVQGSAAAEPGPTPFYRETPRWGLHPAPDPAEPAPDRKRRSAAASARSTLTATLVLFVLAAVAEAFRYGLMLRNRSHLVHQMTVAISDATALVLGYAAMVFVVASAVTCTRWLIRARAQAFAAEGTTEPRRARRMAAGMLVPVVNLVYPGVFLTELAMARRRAGIADDEARTDRGPGLGGPRSGGPAAVRAVRGAWSTVRAHYRGLRDGASLLTLVRFWWALWVLCNITAVAVAMQRWDPSVQARADNVVYTLYADLLAISAVVVTRIVLDRVEGRADAHNAGPARWVMDTSAFRAEPAAPAGDDADVEPAGDDADAQHTDAQHTDAQHTDAEPAGAGAPR